MSGRKPVSLLLAEDDIIALLHIRIKTNGHTTYDNYHIAHGNNNGYGYLLKYMTIYGAEDEINMPDSGVYITCMENKEIVATVEEYYPICVTWETHVTVGIVGESAYMDENYLED